MLLIQLESLVVGKFESRGSFNFHFWRIALQYFQNRESQDVYEREMAYGVSTQCCSSPRWLKMIRNRSSCQKIAEVNTKSSLECQRNLLMLIFYSFGD
ncbi:unnamed protein product [Caenorhabditis angaria]|uniref:Uncharacterized protein n=1 Tax=Caenorhabditis angaria TaxID=860376 RepID=A0A9P1IAY3_9PELO|nr:unnamed protein product [Caenorhabditis angaria]